jgi:hypothetical protein
MSQAIVIKRIKVRKLHIKDIPNNLKRKIIFAAI